MRAYSATPARGADATRIAPRLLLFDSSVTSMFSYTIDPARKRIDAHVGALTSGAELVDGMQQLLSDEGFDPRYGILIDLRLLERAPSVAELAELASFVRERAVTPNARRAFVTSSPVFYEIAVLFTQLTRGAVAKYRVFLSPDEAEAWLSDAATPEPEDA